MSKNVRSALRYTGCCCCCCCCCLLFITFSVLVANPKQLLYTVANPARGLLNREYKTKEKVAPPPRPPAAVSVPHAARSEKRKEKLRDASACLTATQVSVRFAPVQVSFVSSTGPTGVASQNSMLPCAITTFPVSLPLSSTGDV